jgi:hypothetical protein
MHIPETSGEKTSHYPDTGNSNCIGSDPIAISNEGRYRRKKIVVVGLGMVALSFMCVVAPPGNRTRGLSLIARNFWIHSILI